MHFRLGQAARHDAQDQASWHPRRQRRLLAQSDRLQSDPHSQIGCGVSGLCVHTTPKYFVRAKKPLPSPQPRTPQNASKTPTSEFFSELLELDWNPNGRLNRRNGAAIDLKVQPGRPNFVASTTSTRLPE